MKIAFTICSANYLPYAKALADSLVRYNPDFQFVIALADTYADYSAEFFAPHTITPVAEMGITELDELTQRYTIFQLSCALKPYVAEFILDNYKDCNRVFYFDSDILLFDSLTEADKLLEHHSLLLTPHVSEALPFEVGTFTELDVLNSGIYNAGFFAINRSEESCAFLAWWRIRLEHLCINDATRGLFDDQAWLNLAPLYFKKTHILYHPGYNLAYWNFTHRKLAVRNGNYFVDEDYPLVFLHFSGYHIHKPDVLSKHRVAYSFDIYPEYRSLYKIYADAVLANKASEFFSLPVTMGRPPGKKKKFKWF